MWLFIWKSLFSLVHISDEKSVQGFILNEQKGRTLFYTRHKTQTLTRSDYIMYFQTTNTHDSILYVLQWYKLLQIIILHYTEFIRYKFV